MFAVKSAEQLVVWENVINGGELIQPLIGQAVRGKRYEFPQQLSIGHPVMELTGTSTSSIFDFFLGVFVDKTL